MKKIPEIFLITAVCLGGILEWYEIGLYIYWPLIILGDYFAYEIPLADVINILLVITTGCIARPLGGILFGNWGDKRGRSAPFACSIILATIPSMIIVFLPSFFVWNTFSLVFFTAIRFLQGIPTGGELPGAICYLFENGNISRRQYLCSYAFVGPQIGLLLSLSVCFLFKLAFPHKALVQYLWRIIFLISGLIGIIGFYLRHKLHETFEYRNQKQNFILSIPLIRLFKTKFKNLKISAFISILQVSAFCILTIIPSGYYTHAFKLNDTENFGINLLILIICATTPPFIGKIISVYKQIPFLEISAIGIIAFSIPLYIFLNDFNFILSLLFHIFLILFYSIQAAFLPYLLATLFPVNLR